MDMLAPIFNTGFSSHITEHCNLNCHCCGVFSPIAKPQFISVESFEKDWTKLSELNDGTFTKISILGGEPLLHPELLQIISICREIFPKPAIYLCTNGLLLTKMDEPFWECCKKYNVELLITRYPININENILKTISNYYRVPTYIYPDTPRKMYLTPIDVTGSQDAKDKFNNCWHRSDCPKEIRDGKVWGCLLASHVHHFNQYFNENIEISEKNYIDLNTVNHFDEIVDFLNKELPICRYCKWNYGKENEKWEKSQKKIEEWT